MVKQLIINQLKKKIMGRIRDMFNGKPNRILLRALEVELQKQYRYYAPPYCEDCDNDLSERETTWNARLIAEELVELNSLMLELIEEEYRLQDKQRGQSDPQKN